MVGTPEYMAPEVARGEAIDRRADIYSLGVILYEMLGGSVPFRGASAVETVVMAASQPVPPLRDRTPDLDPELDAVLLRTLAKRPEQRPASIAELIQQLHRCRSSGARPLLNANAGELRSISTTSGSGHSS